MAEADLVCTCTTSSAPLFDGTLLAPGVHVNAVGTHLPDARELDTATIHRGRVVVETRAVALAEAGELVIPIAEGAIDADHVAADLAETVRGAEVRRSPEDVTVFKSVGMAFEDLVVARAIVDAPSCVAEHHRSMPTAAASRCLICTAVEKAIRSLRRSPRCARR